MKSAGRSAPPDFLGSEQHWPLTWGGFSAGRFPRSFSLGSCGQLDATGEAGQPQLQYWEATRLGRTLSFIKKMTGKAKVGGTMQGVVGVAWQLSGCPGTPGFSP